MKKSIVLLTMIVALAMNVFAQYSQLTIFHQNGEKFWVIINGVKQNQQPQANVFIPEIREDYVRVKIIFEDEKIQDIDRNIQLKDVDGNFTHSKYIIKPEKKKTAMRFHSFEIIQPLATETPKEVIPETVTTQPVTEPSTTTTTTTTTQTTTTKPTETIAVGAYVTDPETGQPIGMDVSIKVPTDETDMVGFQTTTKTPEGDFSMQTQVTTTQTTVTQKETVRPVEPVTTTVTTTTPADKPNVYQMPGYNGKIGCPWPMSDQDFEDAKNSVNSKTFEDTKLTVAKQITGSNCLLCAQVKEMMMLFTFEDSKLEFAKFAYDYVYDLNNYYKLNDAFTFSSSVDELDEYIRRKGR